VLKESLPRSDISAGKRRLPSSGVTGLEPIVPEDDKRSSRYDADERVPALVRDILLPKENIECCCIGCKENGKEDIPRSFFFRRGWGIYAGIFCHRRDDEPLDYRVLNRSTSRIAD
jgi:hypothetical protein